MSWRCRRILPKFVGNCIGTVERGKYWQRRRPIGCSFELKGDQIHSFCSRRISCWRCCNRSRLCWNCNIQNWSCCKRKIRQKSMLKLITGRCSFWCKWTKGEYPDLKTPGHFYHSNNSILPSRPLSFGHNIRILRTMVPSRPP